MKGKEKVRFSNFYFNLLEGYKCRGWGGNWSLCHMICRELCHLLTLLCKLQRYWI